MHVIDLGRWHISREAETGAESKDIPMTSSAVRGTHSYPDVDRRRLRR